MDARSNSPQTSLVAKTITIFEAAGFDSLIKPGDVVAIKLHCGEWNNTAYLRPVYARALADRLGIRHQSPQIILLAGGKPVWHASHGAVTVEIMAEKAEEQGP